MSHLILIYGPPAAGKLTVSTELAKLTGYALLDNHKAIDYLPEIFPRSNPEFNKVRSDLGRKIRLETFAAAASAGVNLIATFAPISEGMHEFVRDIHRVVEGAGGRVHLVQLLPRREVLMQRVSGASRQGRKIDNLERWHEVVDDNDKAFETFPDFEHLTIDNSDMAPEQAAQFIIDHCKLS